MPLPESAIAIARHCPAILASRPTWEWHIAHCPSCSGMCGSVTRCRTNFQGYILGGHSFGHFAVLHVAFCRPVAGGGGMCAERELHGLLVNRRFPC